MHRCRIGSSRKGPMIKHEATPEAQYTSRIQGGDVWLVDGRRSVPDKKCFYHFNAELHDIKSQFSGDNITISTSPLAASYRFNWVYPP